MSDTPNFSRSVQITLVTPILTPSPVKGQPRARGAVALSTKQTQQGSALADLRQSGAMKALFPRPRGKALEAIVINTAGGITGGDTFAFSAVAGHDTALTLTTQAAERAYRAQPSERARVENRLQVHTGARLNWLPQETILFEACAVDRTMHVELEDGASVLLVEPLVFGRAAMGETLRAASFKDRIEVRRHGKPLFLDAMTLNGDVTSQLDNAGVAAGAGALALLVYIADDAETHLEKLREMLPETAGASLIGKDVLVARFLAQDSFELRQSLIPIIEHLTNDAPPRSWMT